MLHVLFKGMEKMSKSEDERATVGRALTRGSQWGERGGSPSTGCKTGWSLRKHLQGWEGPLVSNIIAKQA